MNSHSCAVVVRKFQNYVDPEEPTASPLGEEEGVALPLGETTLTCNLGVPIIVVCCKVCKHVHAVYMCVCVCMMWYVLP